MNTRWLGIPLAVLLLPVLALGKNAEEPIDALKARAEKARPQDQAHLFAEIASPQYRNADCGEVRWRKEPVANSFASLIIRRSLWVRAYWQIVVSAKRRD